MLRMTTMILTVYAPFAFALEFSNLNKEGWCLSCEEYKYCLSEEFHPRRISDQGSQFESSSGESAGVAISYNGRIPEVEENTNSALVFLGDEKIKEIRVKKFSSNRKMFPDYVHFSWIFKIEGCDAFMTVDATDENVVEEVTRQIIESRAVR